MPDEETFTSLFRKEGMHLKKQILSLVLLFILMALCLRATAEEGKSFHSEGCQYRIREDGTAEVVVYQKSASTIDIPTVVEGKQVTSIGDYAFSHCSLLLYKVSLPDSVVLVGKNPFARCYALNSIHVSPDNTALAVIQEVLFRKADKCLICYPIGLDNEAYAVPQGIKSIGDYAFYSCSSLTDVVLPDSVICIGDYAFSWCTSLTGIEIPNSVTSIGDSAFSWCEALTSVILPSSVSSIGKKAFMNCPELVLTVDRDSYAMQYAEENGYPYTFPDANDQTDD